MIFRRNRFADTVSRQLDLFAADEAHGLLADVQEQKRLYDGADREDAEEAYGDYVVLSLLYSGTKQRCGTKTDGAFLTLDQALTTLTGGG